jgi:hypothetical protein
VRWKNEARWWSRSGAPPPPVSFYNAKPIPDGEVLSKLPQNCGRAVKRSKAPGLCNCADWATILKIRCRPDEFKLN